MESDLRVDKLARRSVLACTAVTGLMALFMAGAWVTGRWTLTTFGDNYIPMAPSTAWLLTLLSVALFVRVARPNHPATSPFVATSASLSCIISLLVVWGDTLAMDGAISRWLTPTITTQGNLIAGRMSLMTAILFTLVAISMSLPLVARTRYPWMRQVAARLGAIVGLMGLTVLLGYIIGAPLLYGTSFVPMALPTTLEFILLGWALAVTPNPPHWLFQAVARGKLNQNDHSTRRMAMTSVVLGLVVFIGITIAGTLFLQREVESAKREARDELQVVAKIKADQIATWYRERRADAALCATAAPLFLSHISPSERQNRIKDWMETVQRNECYSRVLLLDTNLNVTQSSPEGDTWLGSTARIQAAAVLRSGKTVMSDLHLSAVKPNFPNMDVLVPLYSPSRLLIGVMLLEIPAESSLYPMVDLWPTSRRTAETVLVRAEDNSILFLNKLRYQKDAALKFRLPINTPGLPAATALRMQVGFIEGLDYRGTPVLAAFRPVAGTPWTLVTKLDRDEILREARVKTWILSIILMTICLTLYLGFGLIWQRHATQLLQARLAAEASQHRSDALVSSILENTSAVVYVKDLKGRFLLINRRHEELFHVPLKDIIGKTDYDIFPADVAQKFREADQRALDSGSHIEAEETAPLDDGPHTYLSVKFPIPGPDGKPYAICGISTDITDFKRLQQDLVQAHKMETIGRLAGGIAHDFNNLLQILFGHADILLEQTTPGERLHASAKEILHVGERAAALTRQLLAFSRRQVLTPTVVDLNTVVSNVSAMLIRLIGENIRLTFNATPDLWKVRADVSQIDQVLINLAVNARDAMPNGGAIVIRVENIELSPDAPALHPDGHAGPFVRLSVADNGSGMPPEVKARIFEPFFTTKERYKGTGLGLASVYGIIKQHEGRITVDSEAGKGTVFNIYLPALTGTAITMATPPAPSPSMGHNEHILVVEDEMLLRLLISQTLTRRGYRVTVVGSCAEAEALDARTFDLVFSDVVLSDGNGVDLIHSLSAKHPGLRCVLTSGYADIHTRRPEIMRQPFLAKPFNNTDLLNTLAAALR